ncbi:phosphotransferase enzyme family protein [Photobacterium satsumensis]|uniref:phosphotransferase enzyme family protein n=1 Tax=Photobacterium satsumensis TaxID=2910239 RepID=UPI003D0F2DEC
MEELQGGREGQIYRVNNQVYRPSQKWTPSIHLLLNHLKAESFDAAPQVFGINRDGYEILSYLEGDVFNYPLVGPVASMEALSSAGRLLRQYHDVSASWIQSDKHQDLEWMLPSREPQEVICHGDFAPYNAVLDGNTVIGIIDFDTAHPAPRIWDVAYAVYCWAPFKTHPNDALGELKEQSVRARVFCDSYGLSHENRLQLVDIMIARLNALVDFMVSEANSGDASFAQNINNGHHLSYLEDAQYLERNKNEITSIICSF